jgi:hypothetical protein
MLRRAGEYEARLKELEAERYAVEEDLAQVGRACCVSAVQVPVGGLARAGLWPTKPQQAP